MKINAIIVLYNPKDEFLSHYEEMSSFFDTVFFIDNSTNPNEWLIKELKKVKNFKHISLGENRGISFALNEGMNEAIKDNPDYILTMDQDSRFPVERMDDIKDILEKNLDSKFGIISVNYNSEENEFNLREVPWWITSGNFINVKAYKSLPQGFNVDLFIDAVDQDFCHSFIKAGYKIGVIPGI